MKQTHLNHAALRQKRRLQRYAKRFSGASPAGDALLSQKHEHIEAIQKICGRRLHSIEP